MATTIRTFATELVDAIKGKTPTERASVRWEVAQGDMAGAAVRKFRVRLDVENLTVSTPGHNDGTEFPVDLPVRIETSYAGEPDLEADILIAADAADLYDLLTELHQTLTGNAWLNDAGPMWRYIRRDEGQVWGEFVFEAHIELSRG